MKSQDLNMLSDSVEEYGLVNFTGDPTRENSLLDLLLLSTDDAIIGNHRLIPNFETSDHSSIDLEIIELSQSLQYWTLRLS